MEKFIKVIDDLIPANLCNKLEEEIFSLKIDWKYVPDIVEPLPTKKIKSAPGFSFIFINQNNIVSSHPVYNYLQILYHSAHSENILIKDINFTRIFLQLPSNINYYSKPHVDMSQPHLVCLYYVNDSDGDTIFFDDNGKEIKRASPKKGRVVLFDGSIYHSAGIPQNNHRAIINFCFQGEKI